MVTGVIAQAVGASYFNARRLQESVPWYEQSVKSLELAKVDYSVDLALAYEKVARCYTWDFNFDADKSEKYFSKALELKNIIKQHLKNGGKVNRYNTFTEYTFENAERDVVIYLEFGRMYQAMGDYIKAQEWAEKYKEVLEGFGLTDYSNYAYALYDIGVCYHERAIEYNNSEDCNLQKNAEEYLLKATEYLKAALDLSLKRRGEVANDTIDTQERLGDVYATLKKYGDASNAYLSVISMLENLYGENYERIEKVKEKMMF